MKLTDAARIFGETLKGYDGFWCVAGGWAIDLYLDRQTREHEDLEIVVLRNESGALYRHFAANHPRKILSGEPPHFQAWHGELIDAEIIQLRLDPVNGKEFDLLLTPSENGEWICRRDEKIRRPLGEVMHLSKCGIPVLAPEIVLLFKAKYLREKDLSDFKNVASSLGPEARRWLGECLGKLHPGHRWIAQLRVEAGI